MLHILRTSLRVGSKDDGDTPENLETDEVKEEDKKHPSSEGGSKAAEKLPATGHVQDCKSAVSPEQCTATRETTIRVGCCCRDDRWIHSFAPTPSSGVRPRQPGDWKPPAQHYTRNLGLLLPPPLLRSSVPVHHVFNTVQHFTTLNTMYITVYTVKFVIKTIQHCTTLYFTVQHSTTLYKTLQHCTNCITQCDYTAPA